MAYPETREEIKKLLDDLMEQVWACIEVKKDNLKSKREEIIIKNDIGSTFTKFTELFEKAVCLEYSKSERILKALIISYAYNKGIEIDETNIYDILKFEMDPNLINTISMIEGEESPIYERFENAFSYSMQ